MFRALNRSAFPVALLASLAAHPASAQTLAPGPLTRGEVVFVVHSTFVGRIEGRVPVERAEFGGTDLGAVTGSATVAVARMATGNGTRDRHLRETMEADSYPVIRFDLVGVSAGARVADTVPVSLEGRLTLHGVTRPVNAKGTAVLHAGGVEVEADFALDMRDYGIRPPVRAVVLRVAPDVVVMAHLLFGTTPGR